MEKLGVESQALGQAIYEATQAEQPAGAGGDSGAADDNVVDAEVVDDDAGEQVTQSDPHEPVTFTDKRRIDPVTGEVREAAEPAPSGPALGGSRHGRRHRCNR